MVQGYAISERDYQRIERAVRKIERLAALQLHRRHPVFFGGEGEGGMPYPTERILLQTGQSPLQMTKAAHAERWLCIDNLLAYYPSNVVITLPTTAEMTVEDIYWLSCMSDSASGRCTVSLFPNTDQTIIMPSEDVVYGSGKYVRMGALYESTYGHYQLILVCCAAATWIAWAASTSVIEGP